MDQLPSLIGASSAAGLVARAVCHPLDTAKARIQAQGIAGQFTRTVATLHVTLRLEGFAGLYRGFAAVTVGGVPATALYLTSYEVSKVTLEGRFGGGAAVHLLSGLLAEAVSCVVFVPVDVVKERLQVQVGTGGPYKGSWDALRTIQRVEGWSGLYRGYGATLASFGPFSATYFALYEALKARALGRLKVGQDSLPAWAALGCASAAGSAAAWATSPLDLAKLRMQVERRGSSAAAAEYSSMFQSLRRIFATDGLRGLWKGSMARTAFTGGNTAVTMTVFEKARAALDAK